METGKCFLAVRTPPHSKLTSLLRELTQLGRTVRVVSPADLHVTLKYLGPTSAEQISGIEAAVRSQLADRYASSSRLIGLGAFPNPARPSVVWAGVAPADQLNDLAECCEAACGPLGFPREGRAFQPHVTLARVTGRAPDGLRRLLTDAGDRLWGELPIAAVELLRSDTGHHGARYSTLLRIPLAQ